MTHLHYFNSTNLHTHGLQVTPGLVAPGVYGDYVLDWTTRSLACSRGQSRAARIRHSFRPSAGCLLVSPASPWSAAITVGQRHGGAPLIKGAIDRIPEIAAAFERVFMFQAPVSNAQGFLESFTQ